MAGKQEHKPGVVIDYKNKLDDRFVDLTTQKTTSEANEYLTQFNTNLHSENTQTVGSVSPYFYHSNARPGAKSPMSVEMAQHIFRNTLNALEDALRAEIARAFSSEKYLSDFMKENMISKSEDQTISGFKKFDSIQVDHANIDTELVDDSTTRHIDVTEKADIEELLVRNDATLSGTTASNILNVSNRLKIPKGIRSNPVEGEIWYDSNSQQSDPGGSFNPIEKEYINFGQNANGVDIFDGTVYSGLLKSNSKSEKISLNGDTINIPCGVLLKDISSNESITLEKNVEADSFSVSLNEDYLIDKMNDHISLAVDKGCLELSKDNKRNYLLKYNGLNMGSWDDEGFPYQKFELRHGYGEPSADDFQENFTLGIDYSPRQYGKGNKGLALYAKINDYVFNVCDGYLEKDFLYYTRPVTVNAEKRRSSINVDETNGQYEYTKSRVGDYYGLIAGLDKHEEEDESELFSRIELNYTSIDPFSETFEKTSDNVSEDDNYKVKPIIFYSIKPEKLIDLDERVSKLENQVLIDQGSWQ